MTSVPLEELTQWNVGLFELVDRGWKLAMFIDYSGIWFERDGWTMSRWDTSEVVIYPPGSWRHEDGIWIESHNGEGFRAAADVVDSLLMSNPSLHWRGDD
jgi:hypothetical protein